MMLNWGLGPFGDGDGVSVSIVPVMAFQREGDFGWIPFTFSIVLAEPSDVARTIYWRAVGSGDNPASPNDFAFSVESPGWVEFAPGETSKTFKVFAWGDKVVEPDEGFTVTAYDPATGLAIGEAASGMFLNDDAVLSIAAQAATAREGTGGTTDLTFAVTRSGDLSVSHSVLWRVWGSGDSSAAASDFTGGVMPEGMVMFGPGETTKIITVSALADTVVEPDEDFRVDLINPPPGTTFGTQFALGRMLNDDASVSLSGDFVRSYEGDVGATAFSFAATRTGDLSVAHSVSYAVTAGPFYTADAADFVGGTLPTGIVTFAPGEAIKTITIQVAGDTLVEDQEYFTLTLRDSSPGVTIAGEGKPGVIYNDDSLPLALHDDAYVVWGSRLAAVTGVLTNDDGAANPSVTSWPAHGTLLWSQGSFDYRPDAGFTGIDHFTYHVTAGGVSQDAEVAIHVVPMTDGFIHTLDVLTLTPEEKIAATYVAFFGRAADAAGFEFWVDQFHAGQTTQTPATLVANIASSFAVSDEARAQYEFLGNPGSASNSQIGAFLDAVYVNLFGRPTDIEGRGYWSGQIRQKLAANEYVGSVLIDIIGGAQEQTGFFAHQDVSTVMGKVAVSLAFVHEQQANSMIWAGASDVAAATALLDSVTREYASVLVGVRHAEELVAEHG